MNPEQRTALALLLGFLPFLGASIAIRAQYDFAAQGSFVTFSHDSTIFVM
jgi:hypothetical protein